jgi:hypothetical protein
LSASKLVGVDSRHCGRTRFELLDLVDSLREVVDFCLVHLGVKGNVSLLRLDGEKRLDKRNDVLQVVCLLFDNT